MSYRGKVMGVDHIVNKEIEYSYTPKSDWIIIGTTWLDLVFDTLEMDRPTPRLLLRCTFARS